MESGGILVHFLDSVGAPFESWFFMRGSDGLLLLLLPPPLLTAANSKKTASRRWEEERREEMSSAYSRACENCSTQGLCRCDDDKDMPCHPFFSQDLVLSQIITQHQLSTFTRVEDVAKEINQIMGE